MNFQRVRIPLLLVASLILITSCTTGPNKQSSILLAHPELEQVPTWTTADLGFFLHGSMSTEVVPEPVLRAFIRIYPDLFPSQDLGNLGLIPDPAFGWPVGFSRKPVPHLGGLSSVGVNCAACHVADVATAPGNPPVRVLGVTSHFDAEAYFGAVIVATFRTAQPANMKKFMAAYLDITDPMGGDVAQNLFVVAWQDQKQLITEALKADPAGADGLAEGALFQDLKPAELRLDRELISNIDLAARSRSFLKLFHNMRASLHLPDQPPAEAPPASGPGRNDAFGLLSAVLFGAPQPAAPVKYGVVWNLDQRHYVHWDANTRSPIARNLLASLGLGAPLTGRRGRLDFKLVQRQTELSEHIRPPRYPFEINFEAAARGERHYRAQCSSCHDGPEADQRLFGVSEVKTAPQRAEGFTPAQADRFNNFLAELEIPGYRPEATPGIRSTQKYWAANLAGVWARSPYLHNGSVRTMADLLTAPASRAKTFHRGGQAYDPARMGYADAGPYVLDTSVPANSNAGHEYGTGLSAGDKQDLIEYLKTL